jgi:RNA-directed DNA polymerase
MRAWKEFLKDKKNRHDVVEFQTRLTDNLIKLHRELHNQTYAHGGYYAFQVSDPKPRNIHKASVRDRVVHRLLYSMLYPYFDSRFIHDSYSSRLSKGTHRALGRFSAFSRKASKNHMRTVWILKCDIRKFFATIDHGILKRILQERIESPETLWLLRVVIDSFHTEGKPGIGLPLGNLTSQLLVNMYMNEFDQFAKHELKARHYIRYADDFVFISTDREWLASLVQPIRACLQDNFALELHPDKVSINTCSSGIDFLGWVHFPDHRVLRMVTKRRMFRALADNPKPATVASYRGMLAHGNTHKLREMFPKA